MILSGFAVLFYIVLHGMKAGYCSMSGLSYLKFDFLEISKWFLDERQIASIGLLYSVDINRLYIVWQNVEKYVLPVMDKPRS